MSDAHAVLTALQRSQFRRRQRLGPKEQALLAEKSLPTILEHGRRFITERLAPAEPARDGKQTPWRGHPVFIAQHATATCCRGCLARWHKIAQGQPLTSLQIEYVLQVLRLWLEAQPAPASSAPDRPVTPQRTFDW